MKGGKIGAGGCRVNGRGMCCNHCVMAVQKVLEQRVEVNLWEKGAVRL